MQISDRKGDADLQDLMNALMFANTALGHMFDLAQPQSEERAYAKDAMSALAQAMCIALKIHEDNMRQSLPENRYRVGKVVPPNMFGTQLIPGTDTEICDKVDKANKLDKAQQPNNKNQGNGRRLNDQARGQYGYSKRLPAWRQYQPNNYNFRQSNNPPGGN